MAATIAATAGAILGALATLVALRRRRRRRREEVRHDEARRSAERLAELRSMTGGLAHEIKNPLSTLVLNAQLLREDIHDLELEESTRARVGRRVDALAREAARLREILEDFLRFAGRIRLDRQTRSLRELLDELVDFFRPQAEQSGVLLRLDLPRGAAPAEVDGGFLKQALLNLMLNAVQAMSAAASTTSTATGAPNARRAELLVRLEADRAGGPGEWRIHVIDTGPGIPADRIDSLFLPYSSTKPGGTGLGLATTRRIVEEHGGRVTVHSEVGVGTDFTIHLPIGAAADPAEGDRPAPDAATVSRASPSRGDAPERRSP